MNTRELKIYLDTYGQYVISISNRSIIVNKSEAIYIQSALNELISSTDKSEKNNMFRFAPTSNYRGAWETSKVKRPRKQTFSLTECYNEKTT